MKAKFSSTISALILVAILGCNNSKSGDPSKKFDGLFAKGHSEYFNNLGNKCVEGYFDGTHKRGIWKVYNCNGEQSLVIDFQSNDTYQAHYFASGSGEYMFTYIVENNEVIDILCPNRNKSKRYSCKSTNCNTPQS